MKLLAFFQANNEDTEKELIIPVILRDLFVDLSPL